MLDTNKIFDNNTIPFFANDVTDTSLNQIMNEFGDGTTGFIIVRENIHSTKCKRWIKSFKAVLDNTEQYSYFNMNTDCVKEPEDIVRAYAKCVPANVFNKCRVNASKKKPEKLYGIDAVLDLAPPKFIFIFIKELLLAGKTLNTTHVRMVVDVPYADARSGHVDRIVQGLVGRCCGYNKNRNVIIVTNKVRVEAYNNWIINGTSPANPATHAKVKGGKLIADNSAFIKPDEEDEEYEDEEDEEYSEDV